MSLYLYWGCDRKQTLCVLQHYVLDIIPWLFKNIEYSDSEYFLYKSHMIYGVRHGHIGFSYV